MRRNLFWIGAATGLLLAAGLSAPSAVATRHDPCVHLAGQGQVGQDSGNLWLFGNRLPRPDTCGGEMDAVDPDDWYYISLPATQTGDTLFAQVCRDPNVFTINPWDTDLNVYFLPAGAELPFQGIPPALADKSAPLPAGIPLGSSAQPGCDTLTASVPAGANGGRWYVNVHRDGNQGGYILTVT